MHLYTKDHILSQAVSMVFPTHIVRYKKALDSNATRLMALTATLSSHIAAFLRINFKLKNRQKSKNQSSPKNNIEKNDFSLPVKNIKKNYSQVLRNLDFRKFYLTFL